MTSIYLASESQIFDQSNLKLTGLSKPPMLHFVNIGTQSLIQDNLLTTHPLTIFCHNPSQPNSSLYASPTFATTQVNQTRHFPPMNVNIQQPSNHGYIILPKQPPQTSTYPNMEATRPRTPPPHPHQTDSDQTKPMAHK